MENTSHPKTTFTGSLHPTEFEVWYPKIKQHTFQSSWFQMTQNQVKILIKLFETKPLSVSEKQLLQELKDQIDKLSGNSDPKKPKKPFFLRLSTKSPKDALVLPKFSKRLKDACPKNSPSPLHSLTTGLYYAMKLDNSDDAIDIITSSRRVYQDFSMSVLLDTHPFRVIIREFANFNPCWEFRAFVFDKKLTAITQYYKMLFLQDLFPLKKQITDSAVEFFDTQLKDQIPLDKYVLDLVLVAKDPLTWKVVELNRWGKTASPSLFDWDNDKNILETSPCSCRMRDKELKWPPVASILRPLYNSLK